MMMESIIPELHSEWKGTVTAWLDDTGAGTTQLGRWLQGYDLPAYGHDEEPFVWLLEALPAGPERSEYEQLLARRLALLLEEEPDVRQPGRRPEQLLYNLFLLCAALNDPGHLADPLDAVFRRRLLRGDRDGLDLRGALRAALAFNQVDGRLLSVWLAMIEGRTEFLPGNESDGFEAVVWTPEARDRTGEPWVDAITRGLTGMVRRLETDEVHRRERLKELVSLATRVHPDWTSADRDLVAGADRFGWQQWAVESLPSLYVPLAGSVLTWRPVAEVLKELGGRTRSLKELCRGVVFEVEIDEACRRFADGIGEAFERGRITSPWPTDQAMRGVALQVTNEVSSRLERPELMKKLEGVKRKRREEAGALV